MKTQSREQSFFKSREHEFFKSRERYFLQSRDGIFSQSSEHQILQSREPPLFKSRDATFSQSADEFIFGYYSGMTGLEKDPNGQKGLKTQGKRLLSAYRPRALTFSISRKL